MGPDNDRTALRHQRQSAMSDRAIADDLEALLQAERGKADESDDGAEGAPDLMARSYRNCRVS